MINLYVSLIKNGRLTIDDVPKLWRDKVELEISHQDDPE